jgi:hypothetical protein
VTIKYISSFQKAQDATKMSSMQQLGTIDLTLDDVTTTSSGSGATHNEVIDLTSEVMF